MPPLLFLPIVIAITSPESLRHAHVSTIAVELTPFEVENMSVDNMIVNNIIAGLSPTVGFTIKTYPPGKREIQV